MTLSTLVSVLIILTITILKMNDDNFTITNGFVTKIVKSKIRTSSLTSESVMNMMNEMDILIHVTCYGSNLCA